MSTLNVNKIADASGGVLAPISSVMRNRIINGAMVIDQRNAGASVTPTDASYTLDRWKAYASQTSKFSVQQDAGAVTPPAGFTDYLGVTSLSAYTVGSAERFAIAQEIEGFNVADLGWGTVNAKTVTLSFWVRSSLTGTFGGVLTNAAYDRSYPYSYTISSANTWEQKAITIAGDTAGTWVTNNGAGIRLWFGLGVGSTLSGTAGAWSGSTLLSATGATSVVGTNGATFYITGVQLEVGTQATSFEYRQYGTELALCQRYFAKLQNDGTGGDTALAIGMQTGTTNSSFCVTYPVTMRSEPTVAGSNIAISDFLAFTNALTLSGINAGFNTAHVYGTNASSGGQYRPVFMSIINNTAGFLTLSAEL
jgi:hypothetical protein